MQTLSLIPLLDFASEGFIVANGLTLTLGDIEMTKFAKVVSVMALVLALAACSTGKAQDESVVNGDATFSHAQTK